eukprot:9681607-Alexandrium_andersonii.AAC.1
MASVVAWPWGAVHLRAPGQCTTSPSRCTTASFTASLPASDASLLPQRNKKFHSPPSQPSAWA